METGLSYEEIYGKEFTYEEEVEVYRGNILDKLLGPMTRKETRYGRTPGMRAQTLVKYLNVFKHHNDKVDHQQKKSKMKKKMKSNKFGGF